MLIGAAIGDTIVGKKIGRWGMLIGALAKTIPDFDLFYTGLADPRAYMCHHRGHTHSLVWEALYAVPLAIIFYYASKRKVSVLRFFVLFLVCLWGHSLLDTFTNYGTRLFLPFTNDAYSFNTIAIADLVFTIPILVFTLIAIWYKKNVARRLFFNRLSIAYCLVYLTVTVVHKQTAEKIATTSLQQNNLATTAHLTNPTILNNTLWYSIASNDSALYVAEFSLLHPSKPLRWLGFARNTHLLDSSKSKADVALIKWFSDPYTIAQANGDTLNVFAVKFGRQNMTTDSIAKTFGFYYKLFPYNNTWQMGSQEPAISKDEFSIGITDLWARINGRK
jgi:inner membrane protein